MTSPSATSPALTKEFCSTTSQKLIFYPDTLQQTEFIARQLLAMGFRYYNPAYPDMLDNAIDGCLYLDTDRTIMVSDKRDRSGITCTADGFAEAFIPQPAHPPNARLTLEDCLQGALAFYPRFPGEARGILRVLLGDGATTGEGQGKITELAARAVNQGLLVREGHISFGPSSEDLSGARICTATDLGVTSATPPPEQSAILAAFNEMAARMAEMARRVEAIEKEVLPRQIDKPQLPRQGTTS